MPTRDQPRKRRYRRFITVSLVVTGTLALVGGAAHEPRGSRFRARRYAGDPLANYTNALILNQKVYVPLFGIDSDGRALETWQRTMPGYQVLGFEFDGADGWTYTDALHCRTKAIRDSTAGR